jgi:DNA-binding NtrC family response regulator
MEERKIQRIGGNKEIDVDLRIISATNKNIDQLIGEEKFRLDLYHRINTFIINIPPLRERPDDVGPLLQHFVDDLCRKKKKNTPVFDARLVQQLRAYSFPGNVRELRNLVERALILYDGHKLKPEDFVLSPGAGHSEKEKSAAPGLDTLNLDEHEKTLIETALKQTGGNQIKAADLLGISRDALKHRLKKHGIMIHKTVD